MNFSKQKLSIRVIIGISLIVVVFLIYPYFINNASLMQETIPYGDNPSVGKYLQVGDAKIYYEIYGAGEPVVLLHGGLFGSIGEFRNLIPELSKDHLVIAIATRGHGKSELGTKTISYQLYADDYAAVIKNVTKEQVNVLGFSDGAIAAYHLTVSHPEMVKRLISVGGPLGNYGYTEKGTKDLSNYDTTEKLEKLAPKFVADRKKQMSNEASWNRFIEDLARMWKQREYISKNQIKTIKCPVLIAGGDHDEYSRTEHLVEIYKLLLKGQLAIVPNSGHTVFRSQPNLMLNLVKTFLETEIKSYE